MSKISACPICSENHALVLHGNEITMNSTPHGVITWSSRIKNCSGNHVFFTINDSVQKALLEPKGYIFRNPQDPRYFLTSEYCPKITTQEKDSLFYQRTLNENYKGGWNEKHALDTPVYNYTAPFTGIARLACLDIINVTRRCKNCTLCIKSTSLKSRANPEKLYMQ